MPGGKGESEEPGEGLGAGAVVGLCEALGPVHYDRFIGELSAATDAANTAAVLRRWAARVRAKAGRGTRHPPDELPPPAGAPAALPL